jgi:hypothetical protein
MQPPLILDRTSRTSGTLPDGRTVPLAWSYSTSQTMMKVSPYFPWGNEKAVRKLLASDAQYLCDGDDWFRGVWVPAPENIQDADYTQALLDKRLRAGASQLRLQQQSTAGWTSGGFAEKSGSTIGADPDVDPHDPEDDIEDGDVEDGETETVEEDETPQHHEMAGRNLGAAARRSAVRKAVEKVKAKKKSRR